jgi:putative ABC transport system permease protein
MTHPPRRARAVVERWVSPHLVDAVVGDLDELHALERPQSAFGAWLRYWRRALSAAWHLRSRAPRRAGPVYGASMTRNALSDLTHGFRLFTTQPGFTGAAVITLALAIGANSLIFSMANVLLLKPLPIRDPERLGWILMNGPNTAADRGGASLPEYAAYKDLPAFATLGGWWRHAVTVRDDGNAERLVAQHVIGDLQGIWGLTAVRGRTLTVDDERLGQSPVTVLSHQAWTTRYGQRDDVLGRDLLIDGVRHAIVGVLAPDIELGNLSEIDLWLPNTAEPSLGRREDRRWRLLGRLRDGSSLEDARVQVAALSARLATEFPTTNREWTARVGTTRDALGGSDTWLVLGLLLTVVGLLLVLACANIMNLLIARLIARQQELAVRTALGATRGRIVRQVVAEGLVIGLAGGVAGLALAALGLQGVHALASEPFFQQIGIDWRVVGFAFALALVAPLLFSIAPTLRVLRADVRSALSEAGTRTVGSARVARGRGALVTAQVALAVTLVVVAALVAQSVRHIVGADVGYDTSALLSTSVEISPWSVPDDRAALTRREALVERAAGIGGAEGAATTTVIPALQFPDTISVTVLGRETVTERDAPSVGLIVVSDRFFEVFGIPVMAGRGFTRADARPEGPAVAVVSDEASRRYFGGDPLGTTIRVPAPNGGAPQDVTVVGVARDTANADLDQALTPVVYMLDAHRPARRAHLVVRGSAPAALAMPLRAAIRDVDPDVAPFQLRTLTEAFADELSSSVLLGALFVAFAGVAVLLAAAGLYGVMSYVVSQRTPEIAVRLALGASTRAIGREVVGRTMRLALIGALAGLAGAYALAQTMGSLLYGVTASDPMTYGGAVLLALASAAVAAWTPMRRAAAVDPLQSLRQA